MHAEVPKDMWAHLYKLINNQEKTLKLHVLVFLFVFSEKGIQV